MGVGSPRLSSTPAPDERKTEHRKTCHRSQGDFAPFGKRAGRVSAMQVHGDESGFTSAERCTVPPAHSLDREAPADSSQPGALGYRQRVARRAPGTQEAFPERQSGPCRRFAFHAGTLVCLTAGGDLGLATAFGFKLHGCALAFSRGAECFAAAIVVARHFGPHMLHGCQQTNHGDNARHDRSTLGHRQQRNRTVIPCATSTTPHRDHQPHAERIRALACPRR